MKNMLVFGSLRKTSKRGYNFQRFGGQTYIKTITINGFEMYAVGKDYPTICEGKGKIVCELHSVDEKAFTNIQRMEAGAGYEEKQVEIEGVTATIFAWPKQQITRRGLARVESGDWN